MSITRSSDVDPLFLSEVRAALVGQVQDGVRVDDVRLSLIEDLSGDLAWRVTLVLPRPRGDTWDLAATETLEDQARTTTEAIATRRGEEADGLTSVVLTTEDALVEDVALDPGPEPGERTEDVDDESVA